MLKVHVVSFVMFDQSAEIGFRWFIWGLDVRINSLIYSGEKINGRAVVCCQISAIKTS